ncbi:putative poly A polymerase [Blattamonas nauphoetae]|uniref:polynucleotide adenylyltransferase n=1 Tax=Blattamonas nauphoetae TaxID=2049346 RepID=A0ABQ9Y9C0_9EUKA|nr:putative poly A polymerase [Blattamonas nauphoetae]
MEPLQTSFEPIDSGYTPFDTTPPSDDDKERTKALVWLLSEEKQFETPEGQIKRETALQLLHSLAVEWVRDLFRAKFPDRDEPEQEDWAFLVPFGSYRYGVVTPEDDIDTILLCPSYVDRTTDFFAKFTAVLTNHPHTKSVVPIPTTFVPHMKIHFFGYYMDILFANLPIDHIPKGFVLHLSPLILACDPLSLRSLNGYRVAAQLLHLIPNLESFRCSLTFIKLWAHTRGIYGNIFGYLGGIAWAVLTSMICILFPTAEPGKVIEMFFQLYSEWDWASMHVSLLTNENNMKLREQVREMQRVGIQMQEQYNKSLLPTPEPINSDSASPSITPPVTRQSTPTLPTSSYSSVPPIDVSMPNMNDECLKILIPIFPTLNAAHNTTRSTTNVIKDELQRGYDIIKSLKSEPIPRASSTEEAESEAFQTIVRTYHNRVYHKLLEETNMFVRYKRYIRIEISSDDSDDFRRWGGYCASRLRALTQSLEMQMGISLVRIHPHPFDASLVEPIPVPAAETPPETDPFAEFEGSPTPETEELVITKTIREQTTEEKTPKAQPSVVTHLTQSYFIGLYILSITQQKQQQAEQFRRQLQTFKTMMNEANKMGGNEKNESEGNEEEETDVGGDEEMEEEDVDYRQFPAIPEDQICEEVKETVQDWIANDLCNWSDYDQDSMFIRFSVLRKNQLPRYVFHSSNEHASRINPIEARTVSVIPLPDSKPLLSSTPHMSPSPFASVVPRPSFGPPGFGYPMHPQMYAPGPYGQWSPVQATSFSPSLQSPHPIMTPNRQPYLNTPYSAPQLHPMHYGPQQMPGMYPTYTQLPLTMDPTDEKDKTGTPVSNYHFTPRQNKLSPTPQKGPPLQQSRAPAHTTDDHRHDILLVAHHVDRHTDHRIAARGIILPDIAAILVLHQVTAVAAPDTHHAILLRNDLPHVILLRDDLPHIIGLAATEVGARIDIRIGKTRINIRIGETRRDRTMTRNGKIDIERRTETETRRLSGTRTLRKSRPTPRLETSKDRRNTNPPKSTDKQFSATHTEIRKDRLAPTPATKGTISLRPPTSPQMTPPPEERAQKFASLPTPPKQIPVSTPKRAVISLSGARSATKPTFTRLSPPPKISPAPKAVSMVETPKKPIQSVTPTLKTSEQKAIEQKAFEQKNIEPKAIEQPPLSVTSTPLPQHRSTTPARVNPTTPSTSTYTSLSSSQKPLLVTSSKPLTTTPPKLITAASPKTHTVIPLKPVLTQSDELATTAPPPKITPSPSKTVILLTPPPNPTQVHPISRNSRNFETTPKSSFVKKTDASLSQSQPFMRSEPALKIEPSKRETKETPLHQSAPLALLSTDSSPTSSPDGDGTQKVIRKPTRYQIYEPPHLRKKT